MDNSTAITILRRERDGWIKDGLGKEEEVQAFDLAINLMEQLEKAQKEGEEFVRARGFGAFAEHDRKLGADWAKKCSEKVREELERTVNPFDDVCKPEPAILRPAPYTVWQLLDNGTINEIRNYDPMQMLAYAGDIYATREAAEKAKAEREKMRRVAEPETQSLLNPPWLVATRVLSDEFRKLKKRVKKLEKQLNVTTKQTAQKLSALEARIATQQSTLEDFIAADRHDRYAPSVPTPWNDKRDTLPWIGPTCKE